MSDLGKDASITLITGLPGSGKTLRVVHYLEQAIAQGEVVFVCNLNGLKIPHIPFDDPRDWRDLPAGSVLVVDEAQRFFRARRSGEPPKYLTDMETIRHDGVRLILTTQQPDYLDTHLRGLVGRHEHLLREDGKQAVKIFRHAEVMDNVRSEKARARYDSEVWAYPARLFDLYESAEVHTVKRTIKSKFKRGAIMAGASVLLILAAIWQFSNKFDDEGGIGITAPDGMTVRAAEAAGGDASGPAARKSTVQATALERHRPEALEEYFANLRPRTATLPWSAPIYDERPAVAEPRVFCMQGGEGIDANGQHKPAGYTCITEQGSQVVMPEANASLLARRGEPYNPFRQPLQDQAAPSQLSGLVPEGRAVEPDRDLTPRGSLGTATGRPMVDRTYGTITRPAL